jgi:septum site-determining protein MinC
MTSNATISLKTDSDQTTTHQSMTDDTHQHSSSESQSNIKPLDMNRTCLKLKGSLVPMTVLELSHYDQAKISLELTAKTTQAPGFFENLPVIIDLEKLDEHEHVPFHDFIDQCQSFSIKVVAIRGGHERHQIEAKKAGLGVLAKQKDRPIDSTSEQITPEVKEVVRTEIETVEVIKTVVQSERQKSKIIHTPVRSGQQVYAADGDLIVLASVSAGAEILADGNIHVYGALRGRALAGVKGDISARIFCHSLEAELVSIAGQYKVSEDMDKTMVKKPTQVFLSNDALSFKELVV